MGPFKRKAIGIAVVTASLLMTLPPSAGAAAPSFGGGVAVVPMDESLPAAQSNVRVPVTVTQRPTDRYGLQATITWESKASPAGGWLVARDGKDTGGTGLWSTVLSSGARTHTFNYLVPGQTYNLVLRSSGGDGQVQIVAGKPEAGKPEPEKPEVSKPEPEKPATTSLNATVTQDVDPLFGNRATLRWTSAATNGQWQVSRDGKDTGGTGHWETVRESSAREHIFNFMISGEEYDLTVRNLADGRTQKVTVLVPKAKPAEPVPSPTPKPTPSPSTPPVAPAPSPSPSTQAPAPTPSPTVQAPVAPTPTPAPTQQPVEKPSTPPIEKPSGSGWLSGVATDAKGNSNPGGYFGDWRGSAIQIGHTWPNTLDLWGVHPSAPNSWGNWSGPMSVSIAPGVDGSGKAIDQNGHKGWRGWKALANGENDSWWREAARNMKKLRAGKGTTFVSPMYEFNGEWMPWSVNGDVANFKTGWERMARIWKEEYPEAVLVLPVACNRGVKDADLPNPNSYDMLGCTIYNAWPWNADGKATIAALEKARLQAKAVGKPIGITEWANSANGKTPGGGGDAPGFIKAMNDWMKANAGTGAGQLVFETFFNVDGYALDHRLLTKDGVVSSTQRQTAAEYQRLW